MRAEGSALMASNGIDSQFAQLEQTVQLTAGEGSFLAAALHFYELPAPCHDQIHVYFGILVLEVVKIEKLLVMEQADTDGGDAVGDDFFERGKGRGVFFGFGIQESV